MSKIAKAATGLMIITMLSKVLGFIREMVLGANYGTTYIADAYVTAMNIPIVIFALIGGAIATSYIPIYTEVRQKKGEKEALDFSNNILTLIVVISIVVTIIGLIFTEPIVKLFAIGYEGEKLAITIKFARILLLGTSFIGATYIIKSYLESNGNFIVPGMAGIPYNLVIITAIILSFKFNNVNILAWGALLGIASQFLVQVPASSRIGYKYIPKIDVNDEYFRKMLILIAPILIGASVNQVNVLFDRTLASTLAEGSVAALNYANRLNQFVTGLFIIPITAVIYPLLANLSTSNNNEKFEEAISKSINIVVLMVVPISVGAIILAHPIVKILFERGAFDARATQMTSIALIFFSIGLLAVGLRDILTKGFYALKDTKTPMKNGVIAVIINIIANILLIKKMGIAGLALGTSLSAIVSSTLLFFGLRKKIESFNDKLIFSTFFKTGIAALIMGILTKLMYVVCISSMGSGKLEEMIALLISVTVGAITYGVLVVMLKVDAVDYIIEKVKSRIKK